MQAWEEIAYARQEGYDIGYAVGFYGGMLREYIDVVCKKLAKGKNVEQIADELEQEKQRITGICHVAEKYAPDYDRDAIYQEMTYRPMKSRLVPICQSRNPDRSVSIVKN